jgi:branched-chain amino acid transport system substrate-binding protein
MNRIALTLAGVTVLAAACSPSTSPQPSAGAVIEIASELPLGDVGVKDAERAVDVAIAEHPTLRGYRLTHLSFDDSLAGGFDVDRARQNAQLMVRDRRVLGVIGPWNSLSAHLVVPVTGQDNLVMISPSTTEDCLTAGPTPCFAGARAPGTANNFFRIAATNSVAAQTAADFAIRKLGITRFAVLEDDDPFGRAQGEAFVAAVQREGGVVVLSSAYSPTDLTYKPLLNRARAVGAEAIYMASASFLSACRVRHDMTGVFPPDAYFISGDGVVDALCISDAGVMAANDHLVATISAKEPATVPAALRGLSRGHFYDAYNFAAYDCAKILIAAIDRAIQDNGGKIPTREQVLKAVAATSDFKGITGTFSFNASGDAAEPSVSFYYVRNGNWTFWQNG